MTDNFKIDGGSITDPGTFFYYCGDFSQALIEAAADAIRLRLNVSSQPSKTQRRIISAFIEMGQNIVHYSAESLTDPNANDNEVRFGKIQITVSDGIFSLTCVNPVLSSAADRLKGKLHVLTNMSMEEIRESYRAALRADEQAESKGGGLGFLTLARESSEPLRFSFEDVAHNPSFKMFYLTMTV